MVFGRKRLRRDNNHDSLLRKEERFKKVASRRVQEILNKFRLLRNCANKGNYSYTNEDIRKLVNVIEKAWKDTKSEFNNKISKKEKFSFD